MSRSHVITDSTWRVMGKAAVAAFGVWTTTKGIRMLSTFLKTRGRNVLHILTPTPEDIEVAQSIQLTPVSELFGREFGLKETEMYSYGPFKGKLSLALYDRLKDKPDGNYVVVCGINPTPLGEGKSTTTVGLSQAIGAHLKHPVLTCIRQPSMGPTFGVKGGAAGGGYSQVVPMEEFNLHMTGDIHAITAANNLFAAAIDARIFHERTSGLKTMFDKLCPEDKDGKRVFENSMIARLEKLGIQTRDPSKLTEDEKRRFCLLDIDPSTITWKRVTDTNDRFLRAVDIGKGKDEKTKDGEQLNRMTGFAITVASEIMAVLALATDLGDLRARLGRMIACYSRAGVAITADDFGITGALTVLMMDALQPTMMQTLEGTPTLVHAGPFANIAHGNSSIVADKLGLKMVGPNGYVLTEAGFGSDMGGEKFFNIKCYYSGLRPKCAVIVCTVRALKLHSCKAPKVVAGAALAKEYREENLELVEAGCCNLIAHIANVRAHGVQAVVCINRFTTDTDKEIAVIQRVAKANGAFDACVATHYAHGGAGAVELGKAVVRACAAADVASFKHAYDARNSGLKDKILAVVQKVYGGAGVQYTPEAEARIATIEANQAFKVLPVCMSKTQYSLSDDATKLGAPKGFEVTVKDVYVSAGAGFTVVSLGAISFIPGLPIKPAYYKIDLDLSEPDKPRVVGLS